MNQLSHNMAPLETPSYSWGCTEGSEPQSLAGIYRKDVNIAIWYRNVSENLAQAAGAILDTFPGLKIALIAPPEAICPAFEKELGFSSVVKTLAEDIAYLANIYSGLFDLSRIGLRVTALDRAMCPRFHVDRVPCRLVTTYQGTATEWLPNIFANRTKLGVGNRCKPDDQSGLFASATDVQYLGRGDVALLKGESWAGNEGNGLIHRSPQLDSYIRRLLLTFDFMEE